MTFIRTYIDKQATLIKDNFTNNSKNPVLEIVRGEDLYSRFIFSLDISDLRTKLVNNGVVSGSVVSNTINFFNGIKYREDLIGKRNVDGFYHDDNFDLQIFSFDEEFSDGIGYDYIYSSGLTFTNIDLTPNSRVPNWYYKDKLNTWTVPGIYSGTSATIIDTTSVGEGNENISFDISSFITNKIYNTTANTVYLGISYPIAYETAISGSNYYLTSFFSKYTQSFFEPFLETVTNDLINDNRTTFYLDQTNELYLYTNKALDSVNKVEIVDFNGDLYQIITGTSIIQVTKNTYKVSLSIPSSSYPDLVNFEDNWTYTLNGKQGVLNQQFTLLTQNIFNAQEDAYENSQYHFSVSGLIEGENVSRSTITKRVQVNTKRLFNASIELEKPIDYIEYRLYIKQGQTQIEIFPFTKVNKTYYNNYFDLDVESLIPQTYYLELRAKRNDIILNGGKSVKFYIVSER